MTKRPKSVPTLVKRVLVIHRDEEIKRQLEIGLQKSGWEVFLAVGRSDCLPVMYQVQPELIFLGVDAEQEETWETFRCIRLYTDKPVILLVNQFPLPNHQFDPEHNAFALYSPVFVPAAIAFAQSVATTTPNLT